MNVFDVVKVAHSEVVFSSPYFVPGRMGVQAFTDLCQRSVKVTILTNSLASNDEAVVHAPLRALSAGAAARRPRSLRAERDPRPA